MEIRFTSYLCQLIQISGVPFHNDIRQLQSDSNKIRLFKVDVEKQRTSFEYPVLQHIGAFF